MASNRSSLLSRPWVLATTGFIAAYGSYVIWSNWPSQDVSTNLRRRTAVRNRHHPRSTTRIWASSPSEPSLPFGLLHIDYEGIVVRFPNGPEPPTVAEIQEALNVSSAHAFDLTMQVQQAALQAIFAILLQPTENMSDEQAAATREIQDLVPLLRQPSIDELLAKIHILCSGSWKFHHAAVVRAFGEVCGIDRLPAISDGTQLDFDATDSEFEHEREPAQGIKGLLYSIAEEKAKRQSHVHSGIRCEQCGQFPILGVRWHCMNCTDFDLCATCEANPMHPKTHVFVKIKIPLSFLGQYHQVIDVLYPGDPTREWPDLRPWVKKQLTADYELEDCEVEAWYEKFQCTANIAYREDPLFIGAAIDRRAFNKVMTSPTWNRPLEPNFLYDRMFNFYDTDGNGLIDLQEFVSGMAYLRSPAKRTSMQRIFLGYDVDGDGYVSRRDFVRMLSAKYAAQKNIVADVVKAAELDMVRYNADVVRSSQPISAAFAQEDVPAGQTRPATMKVDDRYGERQVRSDAGPFASAVLPDGLEVPDKSLIRAMALRYGLDSLPANVAQSNTLSAEPLTDFANSLNRLESVPIDGAGDLEEARFLVATDLRQIRERPSTDDPATRWRQDLMDADTKRFSSAQGSAEQSSDDAGSPHDIPAHILERGRAYQVPAAEKDFGKEVIFQVVQEGLNELLDPIFEKHERLAERVRASREERRLFREAINDYVRQAKKHQEELRTGSEIDPLLAIANQANNQEHNNDEEAGDDPLLHVSPIDQDTRQPTPREIAMDLQEHITQQSRVISEDLDALESNIREQSLEDLLAHSGYAVDPPDDPEPSALNTTVRSSDLEGVLSPALAELMGLTINDEYVAPAEDSSSDMPASGSISSHGNYDTSSVNSSDQSPNPQGPFPTPNMDGAASTFQPFQFHHTPRGGPPPRERLRELARLDEEEKKIHMRGGPGRLNLEELECAIKNDPRGMLKGVLEGWLEWAEF